MISFLTDHLLESTLFALFLGAMTLCFARERASVRHGIWFAASVKFLLPFLLVVAAGESLRWTDAPAVTLALPWSIPLTPTALSLPAFLPDMTTPLAMAATTAPSTSASTASGASLELLLVSVWIAGAALLLCRWTVQWHRLNGARASATPASIGGPIPVLFTNTNFGPGLVGIFRPVLLLPEGIADHLSPEQLAYVIKHELCHWRRRDNLTGAVHMIVTLLFWFHPLVWWIGRRLVAERERACDESVLASGNDPIDYAESILEVCRFYVRSPLVCAAGVAGANLKDRVERIIRNAAFVDVGPVKSLLLMGVAAGAVMIPMASGLLAPHAQAHAAPPTTPAPHAIAMKAPPGLATAIKPTRKPAPTDRNNRQTVHVAAHANAPAPYSGAAATREAAEVSIEQVAAATPAEASTPTTIAPPPTEEIVVSSKRIRDYVRTRNFVRDYTAPSSFLDQISRWGAVLCVKTDGLAAGYNAFVTARVKEVAGRIGVPQAKTDDCEVNVSIIFTTHPQALLDHIRTERPDLLGPHYPARRRDLATVRHPIQAWYATGTRDSRGRWSLDRYDWNEPVPGEGPPVYYTLGSHLRTGMTSEFASVVIVADITKIQDREIGSVADYIAMTALARMKTLDKCQQLPSISNVFGSCAEEFKAKTLSDYDIAYLKAVYTSAGDAPRRLQESGIGYYMVKILEDQVAAQKQASER